MSDLNKILLSLSSSQLSNLSRKVNSLLAQKKFQDAWLFVESKGFSRSEFATFLINHPQSSFKGCSLEAVYKLIREDK